MSSAVVGQKGKAQLKRVKARTEFRKGLEEGKEEWFPLRLLPLLVKRASTQMFVKSATAYSRIMLLYLSLPSLFSLALLSLSFFFLFFSGLKAPLKGSPRRRSLRRPPYWLKCYFNSLKYSRLSLGLAFIVFAPGVQPAGLFAMGKGVGGRS